MSTVEGEWSKRLEAIEAEGISTKAYAQREGLSAASLYYWRGRLAREMREAEAIATSSVKQFVAVQLSAASEAVRCTLVVAPGVRLELAQLPACHLPA
jgi:transposase